MIILHPDILVTATSLSSATECARKAALNERYKTTNDGKSALVFGSLIVIQFDLIYIA